MQILNTGGHGWKSSTKYMTLTANNYVWDIIIKIVWNRNVIYVTVHENHFKITASTNSDLL